MIAAEVAGVVLDPAQRHHLVQQAVVTRSQRVLRTQEAVAVAVESRSEPDVLIEDGAPAVEDTLVIPEPEPVSDLEAPVPGAQDVQTTVAGSEVAVGVEALVDEVMTEKSEPAADVSSEESATTLQDVADAAVAEPEVMTNDQDAETVTASATSQQPCDGIGE